LSFTQLEIVFVARLARIVQIRGKRTPTMTKHDIRFQGLAYFVLGLVLSTAGSVCLVWPTFEPSLQNDETLRQIGLIAIAMGVGAGALGFYRMAISKALTPFWAVGGFSMLSPIVGLGLWLILRAQEDQNPEPADELYTYRPRPMAQFEEGAVKIRYSSDTFYADRHADRHRDPWRVDSHIADDATEFERRAARIDPRSQTAKEDYRDLVNTVTRPASKPNSRKFVW
jgi:hypothetical protein